VQAILEAAVADRVTPGGVLALGDGAGEPALVPFGHTRWLPDAAAEAVVADTVYDVASITKPAATTAVLMKLVQAGTVDLDTPLRRLLPELAVRGADRITLRHLVGHAAGFPAHVEFFRRLWAGERPGGAATGRDALLAMAAATELEAAPGERVVYSDVGFILLGFALERAAGRRLDTLARTLVFEPLAMRDTGFVDLEADPPAPRPHPVAPTERCPRRGLVQGEVHDENAHAGGGIAGHAGLFSTAPDLARFSAAMCSLATGTPVGGFDPAVVRTFFSESAAPGTRWRLGWDRPSPVAGESNAGDLWPREGLGHLGFTGCSVWLDPPRGRYVVLLTNRVHPTRHREGIRPLRRAVMDAAAASAGAPP
jgi:CubicO group peptidase (beta-lactamase class C family)